MIPYKHGGKGRVLLQEQNFEDILLGNHCLEFKLLW